MTDLWNPKDSKVVVPSFSRSELEVATAQIIKDMELCSHPRLQRWGPSYVSMPLGNYQKIDGQTCSDSGYSDRI